MKYIVIGTNLDMFDVESKDEVLDVLAAFCQEPFRSATDIDALDEVGGSVLVTDVGPDYQSTVPVIRVIRIA